MVKSRRFHKRVQKRHTRKHKPTRKKNKMKKNYSIKQRGGNAGVAIAIGAVMGAALVGYAFFRGITNNGKSIPTQDPEFRPQSYEDAAAKAAAKAAAGEDAAAKAAAGEDAAAKAAAAKAAAAKAAAGEDAAGEDAEKTEGSL